MSSSVLATEIPAIQVVTDHSRLSWLSSRRSPFNPSAWRQAFFGHEASGLIEAPAENGYGTAAPFELSHRTSFDSVLLVVR